MSAKSPAWSPSRARSWFEQTADTYCGKAIGKTSPPTRNDALQATAGALYWANRSDIGAKSRAEFVAYLTKACGWALQHVEKAADEIASIAVADGAESGRMFSDSTETGSTHPVEKSVEKPAEKPKPFQKPPVVLKNGDKLEDCSDENISELVTELKVQGVETSIISVLRWTRLKRDVARAWLEQGAKPEDRPTFESECSACDRGEMVQTGREFVHTGLGPLCAALADTNAKEILEVEVEMVPAEIKRPGAVCQSCSGSGYAPDKLNPCPDCYGSGRAEFNGEPAAYKAPPMNGNREAKRGRGRPPGAKNKKPTKAWQLAVDAVKASWGTEVGP